MKKSFVVQIISGLIVLMGISISIHGQEIGGPEQVSISFRGTVVDNESGQKLMFANVIIENTNIGTVTNSEGGFIIKVPGNLLSGNLMFLHLGYKTKIVSIRSLIPDNNEIRLETSRITIPEVTILSGNAHDFVLDALLKIRDNYSTEPFMLTAFYREAIKKNRKFVMVAEAVLDVYKAPYANSLENDRIKIYRGRKGYDVHEEDTLLLKFQGGPYTVFALDVCKNPQDVLAREDLIFYDFRFDGVVEYNGRISYKIDFKPKSNVDFPLYEGTIYIDNSSKAFASIRFQIAKEHMNQASQALVKRKPLGLTIDIQGVNYFVNYQMIDDLWQLSYVRIEMDIRTKWERKLFASYFQVVSEMAVTDRSKENITKHKFRESARLTDILTESVADFEDPDFWGEYNVIEPDQSIEQAIDRLSKKLRRQELK